MNSSRLLSFRWIGVLSVTVLAAGCTTHQPTGPSGVWLDRTGQPVAVTEGPAVPPVQPDPTLLQPRPTETYTLQTGDRLDIDVQHRAGFRENNVLVGPDGRLSLPLVGSVEAAGQGVEALQDTIDQRLQAFLEGARVVVLLKEYRTPRCNVLGQVKTPGSYPLEPHAGLLDVISAAGGFRHLDRRDSLAGADLDRAFVARNGGFVPVDFRRLFEQGDLSHNVRIYPNDFIFVPDITSQEVYVLGWVQKPAAVPMTSEGLTVMGALAHAGGPADLASIRNIALVRDVTTNPMLRIIDGTRILRGAETDVPVRGGDVIYVARDDLRAIEPHRLLAAAAQTLLFGLFATQ